MDHNIDIEWVMFYLNLHGSYFLFLLMFIEYLKLPILPSGIVLPATGILISQTDLSFLNAFIISLIAGILGSLVAYVIGYFLGQSILDKLCFKSTKLKNIIEAAQNYIQNHGNKSLVFIRLIPVARTLVSVLAGSLKIKLSSFLFYSTIGIFFWNLGYMFLGYIFGSLFL